MADPSNTPDGIFSLLDTDLYKLTMQCAVLKCFPDAYVAYKFTNRTPHMKLNRAAYAWLRQQVTKLGNIKITRQELEWLRKTCPYLNEDYLHFLEGFTFKPEEHLELTFVLDEEHSKQDDGATGTLDIATRGVWVDTILYEIPLLALVSEAYFKFVDKDWRHDEQVDNAKSKGLQLIEHGCVFSEFGSRRRRGYKTHALVMQGLCEAQKEAQTNGRGWKGKCSGTSNVHMAMRFDVTPVGTVAHEWFMGIAAITDDYASANETAMQHWIGVFGRGVLGIALTDTFGTPAFLQAFARPAPKSGTTGTEQVGKDPSYAEIFTGVRQDSGDPLAFIPVLQSFYQRQGIHEKKLIVFSDSLNVQKCIQYKKATDAAGLTPSFGIGTFFTNDFARISTGEKSVPLNIVIKISEAGGRPAVKLSDDVGKNMGEDQLVQRIKREVGYEDKRWTGGDEAHRWDR